MKKLTIVTILIALGLVLAPVPALNGQAANQKSLDGSKDHRELINLKNELARASSNTNLETLDLIVDNNFKLTVSSERIKTKRYLISAIKSGLLRFESDEDVQVKIIGKRAFMTGLKVVFIKRNCESLRINELQSTSPNLIEKWLLLEHQFQRRADLIPVLYETLLVMGVQEQEVYSDVALARSQLLTLIHRVHDNEAKDISAADKQAILEANDRFDAALTLLLKLHTSYPQLLYSEPYLKLLSEYENVELLIADAKCDYNIMAQGNKQEQNSSIEQIDLSWEKKQKHWQLIAGQVQSS